MQKEEIIKNIASLGDFFSDILSHEEHELLKKARIHNAWFTNDNLRFCLQQWVKQLTGEKLLQLSENYPYGTRPVKTGIIMAGNIPMAGLHDLICVLLSGHIAVCKLSSDDRILMEAVINHLVSVNPALSSRITQAENMKNIEAAIATGSNNTGRYFEYYFRSIPHIIRRNRNSAALLSGHETPEQLKALGDDIFRYFGLGCRNVSAILVPEGYDPRDIYPHLEGWHDIIHHNKYANNYTYHKAILLMNLDRHYDNGFLLIKQDESFYSPTSCLFFSHYREMDEAVARLKEKEEELQCIVTNQSGIEGSVPFGRSQQPALSDFADRVNTMDFMAALS